MQQQYTANCCGGFIPIQQCPVHCWNMFLTLFAFSSVVCISGFVTGLQCNAEKPMDRRSLWPRGAVVNATVCKLHWRSSILKSLMQKIKVLTRANMFFFLLCCSPGTQRRPIRMKCCGAHQQRTLSFCWANSPLIVQYNCAQLICVNWGGQVFDRHAWEK